MSDTRDRLNNKYKEYMQETSRKINGKDWKGRFIQLLAEIAAELYLANELEIQRREAELERSKVMYEELAKHETKRV